MDCKKRGEGGQRLDPGLLSRLSDVAQMCTSTLWTGTRVCVDLLPEAGVFGEMVKALFFVCLRVYE